MSEMTQDEDKGRELTAKERTCLERIERDRRDVYWHVVQWLIEDGFVAVGNTTATRPDLGHSLRVTERGYRALGYVPCHGEAHQNAWIDHCGCCAPRWGWMKPRVAEPA